MDKCNSILTLFFLFGLAVFSACARTHVPSPLGSDQAVTGLSGLVIALDGRPVSGASVAAAGAITITDREGHFRLKGFAEPSWVTVSHPAFLRRTRAAAPGKPVFVRLTQDDGKTIALQFGGDVMLGRRFYDRNGDGDLSDGILKPNASVEMHAKLLENVRPLIKSSDLTVVNLETPLATDPYYAPNGPRPARFHPTKEFSFASAPASAAALQLTGIGVVGLANNHVYDMMAAGLVSTLKSLQAAGFREGAGYFGAGLSETQAWEPAVVRIKDQSLAFIGCTLVTGETDSISYVAEGERKGGAAACNEDAIRRSVAAAVAASHIVVFMIHGGTEYDHVQTEGVRKMTAVARSAGATLIINHHPHVMSGFDWDGRSLVAWSLGNFLFDQKLRPTFESCLLTVHLRQGRVVQAYAEPILIEDYVPHGLTGNLAEWVARRAAGRQNGPAIIDDGAMVVDVGGTAASQEKEADAGPGIFPVPDGWQVAGFRGRGTALPGQDLLWTGDFEPDVVGSTHSPLWEMDGGVTITTKAAHAGRMGARFQVKRGAKMASLVQAGRIPVQPGDSLTLTGMARGSGLSAAVRFFPDNRQASSSESAHALPLKPAGKLTSFAINLTVPTGVTATQLVVKLKDNNEPSQADLDEIRLIRWGNASAPLGIGTGFLQLDTRGKVALRITRLPSPHISQ
jgi:poly-gamma-glutamate capsule biosynthesis protein CapA/YwtB (metallophosphatase superfamily)